MKQIMLELGCGSGWSKEGAGKLSELRIYWKNGRKAEELLKGEKEEERKEEERVYSTQDMIKWEKRSRKRNGKYVERYRG
ncbi:MAG: hypothetical protein HFG70_16425 [Hungatella sp.]|nr:hypothetical protein [Hungatella sp.]